jgi:general secretion pathway protein D
MIENLRPLLSDNASMTANEGSNSILLTDTLTNVNRVARIIHAIDNSVTSISTIRVFPLTHADAKEIATIVTQLFAPDSIVIIARGSGRPRFRRLSRLW